jgi:Flp pilus assembly protein TadD
VDWAQTTHNLASAYTDRQRGDRAENIEQAIALYRQALEVCTREARPVDWAQTTHNLANAYAFRQRGDRAENIEQAIALYRQALEVCTREARPYDWAQITNSLASAYTNRQRGDRAENLEQARKLLEDSEDVRTRLGDFRGVRAARRNRLRAHLQRARELALAGKPIQAAADIEFAGALADAWSPEERGALVSLLHLLFFAPVLAAGKLAEATAAAEALRAWNVVELSVNYVDVVSAAIRYLRDPATSPLTTTKPIERSVAYEIVRQANGRKTLNSLEKLADQGCADEALAGFEALLAESPDDLLAWRSAVRTARTAKRLDIAHRYAETAVKLSDGAAEDVGQLGLVLLDMGNVEEAGKRLAEAVAAKTPRLEHYGALASLHAKRKQFGQAADTTRAALELPLQGENIALARMNLVGYLRLQGDQREADAALAEVKSDGLSPPGRTDLLFHHCLAANLQGDASALAATLAAFCELLREHGNDARSTYDFAALVGFAAGRLPEKTVQLLRHWADVASGTASAAEFVQLHGTPDQKKTCADRTAEEGALALRRLDDGRIAKLADIRAASTREDAVDVALGTFAARYDELPSAQQTVCRALLLEALESSDSTDIGAGIQTAAALFWRLDATGRRRALAGLLRIAGSKELPLVRRDTALRVLGAFFFNLESSDRTEVAAALQRIAADFAPNHLRELLAKIGPCSPSTGGKV